MEEVKFMVMVGGESKTTWGTRTSLNVIYVSRTGTR